MSFNASALNGSADASWVVTSRPALKAFPIIASIGSRLADTRGSTAIACFERTALNGLSIARDLRTNSMYRVELDELQLSDVIPKQGGIGQISAKLAL
jgi:hypothetical protein